MNNKKPSFEQAINAAMFWCKAWEKDELSDEVLADRIGELLSTKEGARGFFVISLSTDCPLMDRFPEPIIFKLIAIGEIVVDLVIRNLAMSSAMSIHHNRQGNKIERAGSERIRRRSIELLRLLDTKSVKKKVDDLLSGIREEKGNYREFLKKWNYDDDQKCEIEKSINLIANS